MKHQTLCSFAVAAVLGLVLAGCGTAESTTSAKPDDADSHGADSHADHDHGDHDGGGGDEVGHDEAGHDHAGHDHGAEGTAAKTDMEKMKAELAKLSPEDAASAMKQHFCPVTGDMLGATGPPHKVTVKDRTVWVCCDDCRGELLEDPDKYLAKLDSKK